MNHRTNRRGRSVAIAALAALTLAGVAGCSSDSDGGSPDTSAGAAVAEPAQSTPAQSTPVVDDAGTEPADTTNSGDGTDESVGDAECGGLTAAAIGAAVGAGEFDSADDISVDADTSCLFTNSMSTYGVTVSKESTSSYLAGDLDGASIDDALSSLEKVLTFAMDDATVTRTDVGGNVAIVITGTTASGGAGGAAGTVIDGVVVTVDADGSDLASDPAGFEPIVTNLLALATSS